jgi:SPP1 gp7 family putative phage head morphogenesis protein
VNDRARDTAARVHVQRAIGQASRRKRLPKQLPPDRIGSDYGARLQEMVRRMRRAFEEFMRDMPAILASAARERADADEPSKVRALIDRAEKAVERAVSQRDIEEIAERFATATDTYQRRQLDRQVKAALGIEIPFRDRAMRTRVQGFAAENVSLIKGLSREITSGIEKAALRAVQDGKLWPDLAKELEQRFQIGERRAELIGRDQVGKLYGQVNAARQKELGIRRFIWRTSNDNRVREEHQEREGETYEYDDPPDGELPGEPILCRCYAEPVFTDIQDALNA